MDKNRSHFLARFRGLIQAGAALLTNIHLPNFLKGTLYQGKGKYLCVPGLNCYSCPGAAEREIYLEYLGCWKMG